jgi:hypothetical protein
MRETCLQQLSRLPGGQLTLSDDVGTAYRGTGGGSGGGGNERIGRAEFMPAIPAGASMLTVRWDVLDFPVPISDHDAGT